MLRRVSRRLFNRDEGSALAFVMVGLPVLIVVFVIVVDSGQWFIHKRDLQNQVDAAAFAGSQIWGSCFQTPQQSPPSKLMQQEAQKYDGEGGSNYNPQVGGALAPANFGVLFNSTTFPISQPSNVPSGDDTPPDPCTLTTTSDGKQHYIFDVKATQQKVPFVFSGAFFGINGPDIHATARTELDQVDSLNGILPIGVSDPSPKYMLGQFVDEDNGDAPIGGWISLCKSGSVGCGTAATGTEVWKTLNPVSVTFPTTTKNVGFRLKFVWAGTDDQLPCDAGQLVTCYDNSPSATTSNGLYHIRLYPSGAAGVHVDEVNLLQGSCTENAPYFVASTCDLGLKADVNLGSATLHPIKSVWANTCDTGCAQVWATVDGAGQFQLTPPSIPVGGLTGTNFWTLASGATLPTTGPHTIGLAWQWQQTAGTWTNGSGTLLTCTNKNSNPCVDNGAFNGGAPVQRAFVADNGVRSGPVQGITLSIDGTTGSFQQSSTAHMIGIQVNNPCFDTQFSDPSCPLVNLRVSASATGSESQSLDCDPAFPNIKDEVANGCNPAYTTYPLRSGSTPCPTQSVLWNTPNGPHQPWDCVAVQTGNGDVEGGLAVRIGTNAATCANNWPNFPANDRRQVPLFLVPFSAFNQSGSNVTYPVIGFAAFYITGYKGDPCPNATTSGLKQGTIPGHFIIYLPAGPGVIPSHRPCDPLALTPCIPVLVK